VPFVLDASAAAAWAFSDEDSPDAKAAFERIQKDQAIVPTLWWFEVRNALVISERRNRISESLSGAFLRQLARLSVSVDASPEESAILTLARAHSLSFYDAAYVELAIRLHAPLATLDGAMAKAAATEHVVLVRAA
jgi:predicted nucleic acid-binding protein